MALSYFDKAVIFLLPILVLQLFKDQMVYLSIEYIYSITIVIIPFLDLGLAGYFYYIYRNKKNKREIVTEITKIFHIVYVILFLLGAGIICIHYLIYSIDDYIVYIVSRAIFLSTFAFLSSYYRLKNKPQRGLFVTLSANAISLVFLFIYVFLELEFNLWLIFIGQILFCIFYFLKILRYLILKWSKYYKNLQLGSLIKSSLLFSWPTIIQVFIMMYVANYGKIHALDNMSLNDGVLLSLSQRFSMIIFLTHSSLLAYFIKELYSAEDILSIKKKILLKYLFLLMTSVILVGFVIAAYLIYNVDVYDLKRAFMVSGLIIIYSFLSCFFSYLEMHYGRENKNIIKLYLAIFIGVLFMSIFHILKIEFLERITTAMFVSIFTALILSIIILYKRKYKLI